MIWALSIESPIGTLTLRADEEALLEVRAHRSSRATADGADRDGADHPVLVQGAAELREYFDGTRRRFTVPTRLAARGFAGQVLQLLSALPYGELTTYGELARAAGSPRAARAAGSAVARNPLLVVVPCHRVVPAGGGLGGFGPGPEAKGWLLTHEGWDVVGRSRLARSVVR